MKKYRLIFYISFFLYHVIISSFTFYVSNHKMDFQFLSDLIKYIDLMSWGTLIGLILVVVDFFMDQREIVNYKNELAQSKGEVNALKAKLFDLQESDKGQTPQNSSESE